MIPEAPFLFSIAGLSASLAGLAGLVAGLRRGEGLGPTDLFRLREIVEFAFANALLAVGTIPAALLLGSTSVVARVGAAVALVYLLFVAAVLVRRQRAASIPWTLAWLGAAILLNFAAGIAALATILSGSFAAYEALLVVLLARPMVAFLLVLASFDRSRA